MSCFFLLPIPPPPPPHGGEGGSLSFSRHFWGEICYKTNETEKAALKNNTTVQPLKIDELLLNNYISQKGRWEERGDTHAQADTHKQTGRVFQTGKGFNSVNNIYSNMERVSNSDGPGKRFYVQI